MQANPTRELIRMFAERIVKETFPDETAAARLQQFGLFVWIYLLQGEDEPVTAVRLTQITGLDDTQIIRHLRNLMKRDLIERVKILAKHGRGRAFNLVIKHNAKTKRLLKAIDKATAKKR